MTPKELNRESPSLTPHGDVLTPSKEDTAGHRPPHEPDTDIPPTPGEPFPYPENPDVPGPREPAEPDHGQPIPPELDTTKPRL